MKTFLYLLLSSCVLAACSTSIDMTYYSDPPGATVYEEGNGKIGVAPVTLKYSPFDDRIEGGSVQVHKLTATWVSGVTVTASPGAIPISDERQAAFTFVRPRDALGLAKDEKYAEDFMRSPRLEQQKFVHPLNQDQDLFQSLDRNLNCAFYTLIEAVYADCP
ncbi:MAG: hypothetical protein M3N08_05730 [Pseudomonadota bacterium]|nr:hypothetical protein [Pseudomonadota bacterium]